MPIAELGVTLILVVYYALVELFAFVTGSVMMRGSGSCCCYRLAGTTPLISLFDHRECRLLAPLTLPGILLFDILLFSAADC